MEIKPPKDRRIAERIIFGVVKFLSSKLYFVSLLFGLLFIFAKFGMGVNFIGVYFLLYGILAILPRLLIKRKFRIYEYDPRRMSVSEAQARADLGLPEPGSLREFVGVVREIIDYFRKIKNDPHYAREHSVNLENSSAIEEAYREVTIPFYKITKKVNEVINAPVIWYAKGLVKLELFILRQIRKPSKR